MTPEEIVAVEQCLDTLEGRLDEVARSFYARLFAGHPEIALLFGSDPHEQQQKFALQLQEMMRAIRDLPAFLDRGRRLGARHRDYGVRSSHYAAAAEPLFDSLAEALGTAWTDHTALAWRRAYALVTEGMLQGASTSA